MLQPRFVAFLLSVCLAGASAPGSVLAGVIEQSAWRVEPSTFTAAPTGLEYVGMQDAIAFYTALHQAGRWTEIPSGPLLRMGDNHWQGPLLRQQLTLLGDLATLGLTDAPAEVFDAALHQALLRFQQRHGLKVDGILGPETRTFLNVSPHYRAAQLRLNLRRQEALRAMSAQRYIQVNIPEYRLRLYEQGAVVLEMKTIIGRKTRQTPVFNTTVKTLVVNPDWNVPKSIAYKDILPLWQKDKSYLAKRNLQVLSGWSEEPNVVPDSQIDLTRMYRGANYLRLREPPGVNNTLGQIKFISRSQYAIYMHDTPARHLFNNHKRAFSSGCIRLERAHDLADALLKLTSGAEAPPLAPLYASAETHKVALVRPVPLYVTYWTAWLDENGILNFRDDLYRRDVQELAEMGALSPALTQRVPVGQ